MYSTVLFLMQNLGGINHLLLPHTIFNLTSISKQKEMVFWQCIFSPFLEGYDNKCISVVGIVRNVARQSKVLFSQFVGRAVRKAHLQDPVTAVIVSHPQYNQRVNFDQFDKVTDEDSVDDE